MQMMTSDEVGNGLVLPYVAQAVAGKAGAGAFLVVIFTVRQHLQEMNEQTFIDLQCQACTSIASAQLIATSSIISFDIYGTYINKNPTNKDLVRWSHIGVVVTTIFIPTLATAFHEGGVNMTWLLYTVGNVIYPGCFPTIFALLWKGQTKAAAIASPIVGLVCGLTVWFGTAYAYYGEITITSTGGTMPCLCGCVTSFIAPLPTSLIMSFLKPGQFDFKIFNNIKRVGSMTVQDHDD
jgi:Na+/proline symporter